MTLDVLVVGGGISGVACARRCADAGLAVRLVDRGRRLGGRAAVRTVESHPVDLGAPYCTVSDDRFRAVVDDRLRRGVLRRWTDTFVEAGPDGLGARRAGPMRYAAPAGMRDLVEDLADGLAVEQRTVASVGPDGLVDGEPDVARVVVLAMPGPQAVRLLDAPPPGIAQPYAPVIAVVARFADRRWPEFDGAVVSGLPIRWLADDGRSRGDGAPVLVAHTTPEVASQHLDDPGAVVAPALAAVSQVLGVALEPVDAFAHRWTFSDAAPREQPFLLTDDGIACCGDGWSRQPGVEGAWRSGDDLGAAIDERLTGAPADGR